MLPAMQYDPVKANQPLIADIADFCARRGISKWAFGEQVLNDRKFVSDLETGRQVTQKTMHRLREALSAGSAA